MLGKKDLLGLKELNREQIEYILHNAETMKYIIGQNNKRAPHLQGKSVITLFYENSTRTRISFEQAGKYLGASTGSVGVSTSSVQKGESLIDTAKTIDAMGTDVLVVRHSQSGAPHLIAKNVKASVVNAGDGMNEHPTQALLDLFTIKEKKGTIDGLNITIVGDVAHSRVARSNIYGMTKLGANVTVAGPSTLLPPDIEMLGVKSTTYVEDAIENADVVMGLRLQLERQKTALFPSAREYSKFFGINGERLKLAKKDAILMHPAPVNRGLEITSEIMDGSQSVIGEQVTNGVAIRMAILYLLTRRGGTTSL